MLNLARVALYLDKSYGKVSSGCKWLPVVLVMIMDVLEFFIN